jgi:ribosomal protein S18 acetylase RimI-like enzyme
MSETSVVRKASAADLPAAARLAGELVRMHHERDPDRFFLPDRVEQGYAWWFERELAREGAVILVSERDRSITGYAYGTLEERDWNLLLDEHGAIHDIYVAANERRHGAGRLLLEAMVTELEARGAKRILLSTMVDNERAQRLFRQMGFRPTMLEMTRERTPD